MRESAEAKLLGLLCGGVCMQRGIWRVQSPSSSLSQSGVVSIPVEGNAFVDVAFWGAGSCDVFGYLNLDFEGTLDDCLGARALWERTLDAFRRFWEVWSHFDRVSYRKVVQFDDHFGTRNVESSNTY